MQLHVEYLKYQISDLFRSVWDFFCDGFMQKVGIGRSYLKSVHPSISMCDDHDDDDGDGYDYNRRYFDMCMF